MDIYKLYGTTATDTDALAQVDIQVDGHIVAASLELWTGAADALTDGAQAEVSFASSNGFSSNDTKSSFIHAAAQQTFLTSGGGPVNARTVLTGLAIEVAAGERIFLHVDISGAITCFFVAYLYVMALGDSAGRPAARRR